MTRLILLPTPTADGRHLILRAVAISPRQRIRELVRALLRA